MGRAKKKMKTSLPPIPKGLGAAVKFFEEWAGIGYDPKKETKAQGKRRGAIDLARAESIAASRGWRAKWEHSQEPYEMGDAETDMPSEVLDCLLYDENGSVIGSLGQIGDPSRQYARVVEAELASEALGDETKQETLF